MVEINSTWSKVKKIRDKEITGELGMKKATKDIKITLRSKEQTKLKTGELKCMEEMTAFDTG